MGQRIAFLDGLRGIAILAVMFHHVYINYQGPFPFASRWAALPLRLGWEGVELFFLISGFVILMTLENSASWLLKPAHFIKSGPHVLELEGGRTVTVQVDDRGFFSTDEIPLPGYAIYVTPIPDDANMNTPGCPPLVRP